MDQSKESNWREAIIENLIRFSGFSVIVVITLIFIFLVREGAPTFIQVSLRDLLNGRWYPIEDMYGILPLLVGSFLVTIGAVLISVPLGLATAVYLGEIAPTWQREILKPFIEVLAGIPSIVLGFLGWVALAPLIQNAGAPSGLTAFSGSLILAYMALPTIISITEDALYAVPKEYRERTARWPSARRSGKPSGASSCRRRVPALSSPSCWALAGPSARRWPSCW